MCGAQIRRGIEGPRIYSRRMDMCGIYIYAYVCVHVSTYIYMYTQTHVHTLQKSPACPTCPAVQCRKHALTQHALRVQQTPQLKSLSHLGSTGSTWLQGSPTKNESVGAGTACCGTPGFELASKGCPMAPSVGP